MIDKFNALRDKLRGKKTYILLALGLAALVTNWLIGEPGVPFPWKDAWELLLGGTFRAALTQVKQ